MTPLTKEWVKKAENDFNSAGRLFRARKLPDYDGACFHAQQCAEKYMKALLQEAVVPFPKTHNLVELLALVAPLDSTWLILTAQLDFLSKAAVEIRYPGYSASKNSARDAIATCREVRSRVRTALGLPI